jgi:hypothetical protein
MFTGDKVGILLVFCCDCPQSRGSRAFEQELPLKGVLSLEAIGWAFTATWNV